MNDFCTWLNCFPLVNLTVSWLFCLSFIIPWKYVECKLICRYRYWPTVILANFLISGWLMRSTNREPIMGFWGRAPVGSRGSLPLVTGGGNPPEAESIFRGANELQIWPFLLCHLFKYAFLKNIVAFLSQTPDCSRSDPVLSPVESLFVYTAVSSTWRL